MSDSITHLAKAIEGKIGENYTLLYQHLHAPDLYASVPGKKILDEESRDITEIIEFSTFKDLKWKKWKNGVFIDVNPRDYPEWTEKERIQRGFL